MRLTDIKPLTLDQYDRCKDAAIAKIQARIGERPTRATFQRELGSLWTVLDVLALIVFAAALIVSSSHIITHTGELASASFTNLDQQAGTQVSQNTWVIIHQWGYIALSEASMILFMVLFALTRSWRQYVFLLLAAIAAAFVFIANVSSGTGILESLMPPVFTLGIGFHLERLIVQQLRRRREVDQRYLAALTDWEAATEDPTQHSQYQAVLKQVIWSKLISLKANKAYADAPARLKHAACRREMERDEWVRMQPQPLDPDAEIPATPGADREHRPEVPFGSIAHAPDEDVSMPPMPNGSAHIE